MAALGLGVCLVRSVRSHPPGTFGHPPLTSRKGREPCTAPVWPAPLFMRTMIGRQGASSAEDFNSGSGTASLAPSYAARRHHLQLIPIAPTDKPYDMCLVYTCPYVFAERLGKVPPSHIAVGSEKRVLLECRYDRVAGVPTRGRASPYTLARAHSMSSAFQTTAPLFVRNDVRGAIEDWGIANCAAFVEKLDFLFIAAYCSGYVRIADGIRRSAATGAGGDPGGG